jgi:hypothetical protein
VFVTQVNQLVARGRRTLAVSGHDHREFASKAAQCLKQLCFRRHIPARLLLRLRSKATGDGKRARKTEAVIFLMLKHDRLQFTNDPQVAVKV